MNQTGPFDRSPDSIGSRDRSARLILIGMGVIGVLLLILVLPPISLLSSDDKGSGANNTPSASNNAGSKGSKVSRPPEGFEALSLLQSISRPKDVTSAALTVNLLEPISDGRNLSLYTSKDGKWERIGSATLVNNGTAAKGEVAELPANVAVFRRVESAVEVSGWLRNGTEPDSKALDALGTVNPVDYAPNPDGTLAGSASNLPTVKSNIVPTVRADDPQDTDAVNAILASPELRDAHINALVAVAQNPGNAGIDIDYPNLNPARKADFTSFVTVLAERLHAGSRSLSVSLPMPVKAGVSWDTGAYDWEQIARNADTVKLQTEPDPSAYYKKMEEVLTFLKPKVDLRKVSLIVTRASREKGNEGLSSLSLNEGLARASEIEVRTNSQITPNSSVIIVGRNIFQDNGASGLRWDEGAFAVSFSYPDRGGPRTVWLENSFSLTFRLDLARRFGLGGVAVDDISNDAAMPALWDTLHAYADSGTVPLAQPNSVLLRPVWQIQAGTNEPGSKGNVVWKAPSQPGAYDVSLIVSDGVIRAMQKLVLTVSAPGAATTSTPARTTTPNATGTPRTTTTPQPTGTAARTTTTPAATGTPRP